MRLRSWSVRLVATSATTGRRLLSDAWETGAGGCCRAIIAPCSSVLYLTMALASFDW